MSPTLRKAVAMRWLHKHNYIFLPVISVICTCIIRMICVDFNHVFRVVIAFQFLGHGGRVQVSASHSNNHNAPQKVQHEKKNPRIIYILYEDYYRTRLVKQFISINKHIPK